MFSVEWVGEVNGCARSHRRVTRRFGEGACMTRLFRVRPGNVKPSWDRVSVGSLVVFCSE
jgi:hypothetical protein